MTCAGLSSCVLFVCSERRRRVTAQFRVCGLGTCHTFPAAAGVVSIPAGMRWDTNTSYSLLPPLLCNSLKAYGVCIFFETALLFPESCVLREAVTWGLSQPWAVPGVDTVLFSLERLHAREEGQRGRGVSAGQPGHRGGEPPHGRGLPRNDV